MDQIMMDEHLSFEHKMNSIQNTNNILDQLEKKMNSYFNRNKEDEIKASENYTYGSRLNSAFPISTPQQKTEMAKAKYGENFLNTRQSVHPRHQSQQLEFKMYSKYNQSNLANPQSISYEKEKNRQEVAVQSPQKSRQKQRFGQTIEYKNNMGSETIPNNRASNNRTRKSNEQFRLIGKSKQIYKKREAQRQALQQKNSQQPVINQSYNKSNIKNQFYNRQQPIQCELDVKEKSKELRKPTSAAKKMNQSNSQSNNLLHSMQTIEIVMKQALEGKLRKIRQIQQQIMTQNQERVYLYKVNVRLNQELKFIQEQKQQQKTENSSNLQWKVRRLKEDIQKIKGQIKKKKEERKQLRKQQQTLKDGYETVVNNKKNILKRDIENYMNQQNESKQNTDMLKGLIKQLDKLKGVVQSRIKGNSLQENMKKRKVIKSFKN